HALGVIRMLIERDLPLEMDWLIAEAFRVFGPAHGQAQAEVAFFVRERLVGYLRDVGYSAREVDAVVEVRPSHWGEFPKRLQAV
ncbi:glycine--tRNA ligase subunit beta, partial [Escherichia coli]|nr:glycine--tRNA ligase subunit beta [Escherichia coli]